MATGAELLDEVGLAVADSAEADSAVVDLLEVDSAAVDLATVDLAAVDSVVVIVWNLTIKDNFLDDLSTGDSFFF